MEYGRKRLYPGCGLSEAICVLSKKKVLNYDHVCTLRILGNCDIEIKEIGTSGLSKKHA